MGVFGSAIVNVGKDLLLVDESSALVNDGVGDLSDQNNKSGRSVVVLRVGPDQKNSVHDGHEQIRDRGQIIRAGAVSGQLIEQLLQGLQVEVVVVSLNACSLNFLLEFTEWTGVSGLVLLQELEHLLDALT